jgi:hypothetical protein
VLAGGLHQIGHGLGDGVVGRAEPVQLLVGGPQGELVQRALDVLVQQARGRALRPAAVLGLHGDRPQPRGQLVVDRPALTGPAGQHDQVGLHLLLAVGDRGRDLAGVVLPGVLDAPLEVPLRPVVTSCLVHRPVPALGVPGGAGGDRGAHFQVRTEPVDVRDQAHRFPGAEVEQRRDVRQGGPPDVRGDGRGRGERRVEDHLTGGREDGAPRTVRRPRP